MAVFKKKNLHPVRDKVLAGIIFLVALFVIVFLMHELWVALTGPGN